MVTRRFLRLSLLGLLAFMLFCLVVMEITLHGDAWIRTRFFSQKLETQTPSPSLFSSTLLGGSSPPLKRHSRDMTTSQTPSSSSGRSLQVRHQTVPSSRQDHNNATRRTAGSSQTVGNSTNVPRSTGGGGKVLKTSSATITITTTTTTKTTDSSSSDVNHCLNIAKTNETGVFNLQAQKLQDGSRPVNCSKCFYSRFPPLVQSCNVCNTRGGGKEKGGVELILMILTTHGAAEKRQAIRHTWASITRNNTAHVRHVFVLGRSKNEADMQKVTEEQKVHGDVIVYDFIDTYANLTLKTLTILHWVLDYCHNARFIMKIDDDMWVNVPAVLDTAKKEASTLQTAIGGSCHMSAGPIRNKFSKWYASKKAYPQNSYPGFCSGTGYVTSINVARHILSVSPDVPFFYLEDVYMALCIKRLGPPFRLYPLGGFVHGGGNPCVLRGKGTLTVHEVSPKTLLNIWAAKCP